MYIPGVIYVLKDLACHSRIEHYKSYPLESRLQRFMPINSLLIRAQHNNYF